MDKTSSEVPHPLTDERDEGAAGTPLRPRASRLLAIDWSQAVVLVAVVAALAAGFLAVASQGGEDRIYQWDMHVIRTYVPILARGLRITLLLTLICMVGGLALGVLVAAGRLSRFVAIRWAVTAYIEVLRGTPALVQLVWVYFALPIITGISLPAFQSAALALTLNISAYYGEAFRSGVQAVPREHLEAAEIIGLTYVQRMRYIILPQAFRTVLPVLIGQTIALFKDTSLVSFIGLSDLMNQGTTAALASFRPLEILTAVAVIYLAIAYPFALIMRKVELYLSRHKA